MSRFARLAAALIALLALGACSSATVTRLAYANAALAYSNFGSAIAWGIGDYVDMTEAQEAWVRERAGRAMEWHRAEELPRLRRVLEDMLARADGSFRAEDIASFQQGLRSGYQRAMNHLAPDMAEFLATLGPGQLAHMERKMAEGNREFLEESARGTAGERRKRRLHRFLNHLEAWTGPLGDAQSDIVAGAYRDLPELTAEVMGERRYRQAEMLALIRAKVPKAEMEAQLRRLFVEVDEWRRPDYREQLKARDAKLQDALARLSETLTPKQRAALQSRIRGLIRDIDKLTAAS